MSFTLVLVSGLQAVACGSDDDDAETGDDVPRIGVVEDMRIDGYEAELSSIHWLGVSPTGRIALIESQDRRVRFYDASGMFLGSVGREGEGPGEFRWLTRAGWIADTLWVSDMNLARITMISPELEVLRTIRDHDFARPMPDDTGRFASYRGTVPYAVYPDRSSLVGVRGPVDPSPTTDPGGGTPLFHLSRNGLIQRQVAVIPTVDDGSVMVKVTLHNGGVAAGQIPFVPHMAWAVSPHGSRVAVLTTDMASPEPHFRILTIDASGREIFDRSFPFVPEPIPAARIDSAIVASVAHREPSIRSEMESKLRDAVPAVYAAAERVVIGSDDRVWIGMRRRAEGTRWIVLSPAGHLQSEILLPSQASLRTADAQHLWCVERDELGVESVVRYRLSA